MELQVYPDSTVTLPDSGTAGAFVGRNSLAVCPDNVSQVRVCCTHNHTAKKRTALTHHPHPPDYPLPQAATQQNALPLLAAAGPGRSVSLVDTSDGSVLASRPGGGSGGGAGAGAGAGSSGRSCLAHYLPNSRQLLLVDGDKVKAVPLCSQARSHVVVAVTGGGLLESW